MATVGDVRVNLTGNAALLSGAFRKATQAMRSFGSVALRVGKIAAGAFTGVAVAAVKAATTIDGAQRKLQVGTGATGAALRRLEGDFRVVFAGVPDAAGNVADAMANLQTLFGVTGKALQGLTEDVLDVSRLTGTDASNNAKLFGRAMKGWQKPAKDGRIVLDKLFKTTQTSGIGFSELLGTINEYSVVLRNAGLTMDQSIDLFGRLSSVGISVSRIMPGLNAAFRRWAGENKNIKVELGKTISEIKNAVTSLKAIDIATKAFGAEGAQRLADAIRSGTFALEGLGAGLDNAAGSIQESKDLTFSLGEQFGILRNKVVLAIEPIGRAFIEMFKELQPGITSFIENMGQRMPGAVVAFIRGIASFVRNGIPPIIENLNRVQITIKGFVATFLSVIARILGGLKLIATFTLRFQAAEALQAAIDKTNAGIKLLEESIKRDEVELKNANVAAEKWADTIDGFATKLDGVLQRQKQSVEEAKNVTQKTKEAKEQTEELKTAANGFVGVIEVAGRTIGVAVNGQLRESIALIRQAKAEAAELANAI